MLPTDYADDFHHDGLDWHWFRGVPWAQQSRAMAVDPKMRVIRNPVTGVFVVVLRLSPEDKQQVHTFFGVTRIAGWVPIMETARGEPVEAVSRLCEGMEKSREFMRKHYGETPAQIEAALKGDAERMQTASLEQSLARTRLAREAGIAFAAKTKFTDANSPALKEAMFKDAAAEYRKSRDRLVAQQADEFSLVVPKP